MIWFLKLSEFDFEPLKTCNTRWYNSFTSVPHILKSALSHHHLFCGHFARPKYLSIGSSSYLSDVTWWDYRLHNDHIVDKICFILITNIHLHHLLVLVKILDIKDFRILMTLRRIAGSREDAEFSINTHFEVQSCYCFPIGSFYLPLLAFCKFCWVPINVLQERIGSD